jgi:hypothetical protein
MIDPQARPKPYIKLLVFVAALGLVSALVTFAFMALVGLGTGAIWDQAAATLGIDMRLFTVLDCAIGGLLVGLLVKLFGDHNAIFFELMQEFGKTGRFNYRHVPGSGDNAFVSLITGGVFTFSREVMFQVINVYAIRMAGVFIITLATIWLRSGVMQRGWAFLTYALALVLLVSISFSLWVILIFPAWVLVVSVYFLLRLQRDGSQGSMATGGAP